MVWVPAPAIKGLNILLDTPVPVNVPPDGVPPDKANAGALTQTVSCTRESDTVGIGLKFTVTLCEALHPAALVTVAV